MRLMGSGLTGRSALVAVFALGFLASCSLGDGKVGKMYQAGSLMRQEPLSVVSSTGGDETELAAIGSAMFDTCILSLTNLVAHVDPGSIRFTYPSHASATSWAETVLGSLTQQDGRATISFDCRQAEWSQSIPAGLQNVMITGEFDLAEANAVIAESRALAETRTEQMYGYVTRTSTTGTSARSVTIEWTLTGTLDGAPVAIRVDQPFKAFWFEYTTWENYRAVQALP